MDPKKNILFLFIICAATLKAQFRQLDSLKHLLNQTEDPALRVSLLTSIGHEYYRINEDSMKSYALKAVKLAESLPDQTILYLEALVLKTKAYHISSMLDSAAIIARTGLIMAEQEDLPEQQAKFYNRLGMTLAREGKYDQAMDTLLKAIAVFENEKMMDELASGYNHISIVYLLQNDRENGIKYLKQATEILDRQQPTDPTNHALYYLNLAYATEGDSMSLEYAQIGLQLAERSGKPGIRTQAYMEMGYQKESAGQLDQAMEYYQKNLDMALEMNSPGILADAHRFLGRGYLLQQNYSKAQSELQKALQIYRDQQSALFIALTLDELQNVFEKNGEFEKALQTAKETIVLRDSLFDAEKLSIASELEAKYENQKKETALAIQKLELEKQKSLKNKTLLGGFILLLSSLFVFQLLMSRRRRAQKEAEMALSIQQAEARQLKELDQIKSNFFANISHEFRTPLSLILSPLREMARGDFKGHADTYYRMMLRNGERLLQLINQLLDLSKLEAREMKLNYSVQDMNELLRQTAGNFESQAERKQIKYSIIAETSPLPVRLDRDKTEKVIYNLLSNAFKFTKEEGEVVVSVSREEQSAVLRVQDSGIGIAEADLPYVFDRFFQSHHAASRSYDGSGIGLALTKELVEIQKGQIIVDSIEEKGTVFTVIWPVDLSGQIEKKKVIPLTPEMMEHKQPILTTPVAFSETPQSSGTEKILLVEDNEDVRFYLKEKLQQHFEVLEASNGEEGLQLAMESIPDLIITDIMMPKMDGNQLSAQLRRQIQTSHIPIIMLTARGDMDSKLDGLETGADDYLTKPVDTRELIVRVNNLIAQRKQLKEKYAKQIFFSGQKDPSEEEELSQDDRFMRSLMQILQSRLEDETFGVEELAKALHLSRYQLLRKTKALTGKSVSVFIRWVRLNRAKELLEKGQGNVSEIAFRMGFNSVAYFSSCFKDEFGFPPSQV